MAAKCISKVSASAVACGIVSLCFLQVSLGCSGSHHHAAKHDASTGHVDEPPGEDAGKGAALDAAAADSGVRVVDAGDLSDAGDAAPPAVVLPCNDETDTDTLIASFRPYPASNTAVIPNQMMHVDHDTVFFTVDSDQTDNSYFSVARCGGKISPLVVSKGEADPNNYDRGRFGVDANNLYWGTKLDGKYQVMRTSLSDGKVTPLAESKAAIQAVTNNASDVFWTTEIGVFKASIASGEVTPLSETFGADIMVNEHDLVFIGIQTYPEGGSWFGVLGSTVNGGEEAKLAFNPLYFTLNASHVFSTVTGAIEGDSSLVRITKDGKETKTLLEPSGPLVLTADEAFVYWVAWEVGVMQKVPVDGGAVQTVTHNANTFAMSVDDAYVYWINTGDAGLIEVYRRSK
jgi:hypothetical protein